MKKQGTQILKIAAAVLLLAISINMFLGPHHIAAGGVSGIGILLEYMLGINRAWVVLSFNVVLLILAAIFLGKKVFWNTLFGSILFPLFLRVVPEIMLTTDRLLSVIFGSIIFAVGVALLYKIQASSGGTTIPPLIFEKYFGLNTSMGLFLTDVVIVFMSLYVFGFEEFLFAILSIGITSVVMTYIETGLKRRKAIMIISQSHAGDMRTQLQHEMNRGLTIFDIRGGKDDEGREMILMVVADQEYPRVKRVIDQIDPDSFVITYNVAEVHGLGFTYHPIQ
ncbi:YitT family protein [Enterococcus sp. BWB1-3]|uniref:YitT family protein n=1 Tax=unclassified Enterococcus TaxID=2608891 RepID=UPI001924C3BA|nr:MULTISPECIES: YitT family protein [unclassified Enterococcus]MBL1230161.1 YitT family protein [Enterococcus sp. BWB1-3]MCB5952795.1 YitT family protein [Enterococcus sp. BWT-B8]MCB5953797.1 YitT family protein [Enterococcus sp. CWB-B31]